VAQPAADDTAFQMYVDLMVRCLTDTIYEGERTRGPRAMPYDPARRETGRDWPLVGHSMAGVKRLTSLAELTDTVLRDGIPGDFIETGVWRGGACALMRGILKARGVTDRKVYVADSFEGLPPPDPDRYPADASSNLHNRKRLAITQETVENTFRAYGLLDDSVVFVKGWFKDTLPGLPAERFALVRLDGDMYESTIQALEALYPRLSPGGALIVDDYGSIRGCREAVTDYRAAHGIGEEIVKVDHTGVWWRKGT